MAERQHTAEKATRRSKSVKRAGLVADPILARLAPGEPPPKPITPMSIKVEGLTPDEYIACVEGFRTDQERRTQEVAALESSLQEGESSSLQEISDLLGGHRILGSQIKTELDAHALLHRGLPRGAVTSLVEKFRVIPVSEVSEALGISLRTLQRHKSAPVALLGVQQSGRAWKFAEILAKATRVLGSQEEAEQWLKRPAIGLDQQRPVDLLTTPAGVKLAEDYLGRLEYDVYT